MMGWIQDGFGWPGANWWGIGIMMTCWIALICFGIWIVVRFTQNDGESNVVSLESPRAILDRRFAAGEIDAQTYADARRLLEHPGSPAHG